MPLSEDGTGLGDQGRFGIVFKPAQHHIHVVIEYERCDNVPDHGYISIFIY